ncbi:hypothetical protein [Micromonospora aurantiaca (nom. illeg.)]|uniref:hypothetical protein n=1 Tax=Micromonospora aurantiaca (nom. illeg.) TaxID=47850 RepID=UPI0033F2AB47
MGSRRDLAIAKRMAPGPAAAYERVEADLDDPFQHNRPLASIRPAPGDPGFDVRWTNCPRCFVPVLANARQDERFCPAHASTGPWRVLSATEPSTSCGQQPSLFDASRLA